MRGAANRDFLMTGASQVGALVTVLAGAPPLVFAGTGQIGVLVEQAAEEVQACLDRGYEMTGVIEAVDVTGGTGRLRISGQLDQGSDGPGRGSVAATVRLAHGNPLCFLPLD
jgi:hypothetical protein